MRRFKIGDPVRVVKADKQYGGQTGTLVGHITNAAGQTLWSVRFPPRAAHEADYTVDFRFTRLLPMKGA